jgi:hypothetical protein
MFVLNIINKSCYFVDDLSWYHKRFPDVYFLRKYQDDDISLKNKKLIIIISLTKGGRKYNGPAFSAGQWPSLACKAEKKWTALPSAAVVFSYVISSPSSTFTGGIACLKFFSVRNCNHFDKERSRLESRIAESLELS